MRAAKNDNAAREIITMYAPIFKDKLTKLEMRGLQDSCEAAELRAALARVERAQAQCRVRAAKNPRTSNPLQVTSSRLTSAV